jgi:hypothetical protein
LDPSGILSVSVSIIPLPNHNQAPRNVYQAGMGKQSTGIYHANHTARFDTLARVLSYPSRPVFEPQINETIGLNEKPGGFNALVAILAHPYDQEDSFVVKKEAIERGMGSYTKYTTYKAVIKPLASGAEKFKKPELGKNENESKYDHIEPNGLPRIGSKLVAGDCIIGKVRAVTVDKKTRYENVSIWMAVGEEGVIDSIYPGYNEAGQAFVKVKVRDWRKPEIGDKYSSRSAQKGTMGMILPSTDMPHIETDAMFATPEKITEMRDMHHRNEAFRAQLKAEFDEQEKLANKTKLTKKEKEAREQFVLKQYMHMRKGYFLQVTKARRVELLQAMEYYHTNKKFENQTYAEWLDTMAHLNESESVKNKNSEKRTIEDLQALLDRQAAMHETNSTVNMSGLIPDLLSNPHAIPSRMTMGKMIEFMGANAGILQGKFIDATAFRHPDNDEYERTLKLNGFNPDGKFTMYDGITGKKLDARVYTGFIHYQALRHTVKDKIQSRAYGARTKDTRQPTGGRAIEGGIRVGEMERDANIAHGASQMLRERLCGVSDATEMVYCRNCSSIANVSQFDKDTQCHYCGAKGKFGRYTMPYVFKLLTDFLVGIGFNMRLNMVLDKESQKRSHVLPTKNQTDKVMDDELEEEEEEEKEDEVEKEENEEEDDEEELDEEEEGGMAFDDDMEFDLQEEEQGFEEFE